MNFTLNIRIIDGQLRGIDFSDVTQPVNVGVALQAVEAAKAALLGVVVARPERPTMLGPDAQT